MEMKSSDGFSSSVALATFQELNELPLVLGSTGPEGLWEAMSVCPAAEPRASQGALSRKSSVATSPSSSSNDWKIGVPARS